MYKEKTTISTMVNGIITSDEFIYDLEKTSIEGIDVYTAKTVDGEKGYVMHPQLYQKAEGVLLPKPENVSTLYQRRHNE